MPIRYGAAGRRLFQRYAVGFLQPIGHKVFGFVRDGCPGRGRRFCTIPDKHLVFTDALGRDFCEIRTVPYGVKSVGEGFRDVIRSSRRQEGNLLNREACRRRTLSKHPMPRRWFRNRRWPHTPL